MKIEKLTIENFRAHESTVIEPEKLTLIVGPHESGKSSIKDAIQLALTGKTMFSSSRGLVRQAGTEYADRATITCTFIQNDYRRTIEKIIPSDAAKSIQTNLMSQKSVFEFLGTDKETMNMLLNTWEFVFAKDRARKRYLSNVMLPKVTLEQIAENLETPTFSGDKGKKIKSFLNVWNAECKPTESIFDCLYNASMQHRRSVKIMIAEHTRKIDKITDDLKSAAKALASVPSRTKDDATLVAAAVHVETVKKELTEKTSKLTELEADLLSAKKDVETSQQAHQRMYHSPRTHDVLKEKLDVVDTKIREIESTLKRIAKVGTIEYLSDLSCPYFGRCYAEKDAIVDTETFQTIEGEQTEARLEELRSQHNLLTTEITEVMNLDQTISEHLCLVEKRMSIEASISKANDELERLGQAKETPESVEELVASMEHRIKLDTAVDGLRSQLVVGEALRNSYTDELAILEYLVSQLKPDELPARMAAKEAEQSFGQAFRNTVHSVLGEHRKVEIDSMMNISIGGIPIDFLSESARYRLCLSVQNSVALSSGLGFMVIDGCDVVREEKWLLDFLSKISGDSNMECVIVLLTNNTIPAMLRDANVKFALYEHDGSMFSKLQNTSKVLF